MWVFFNIHPNLMRYDFLAAVWNLKLYQWTFHVVFYVNICWFTLHFDICSAFKWSFNEFVGEKVISLSYSSAIFSPPRLPCTLNGSLYPCMVLSCHVFVTWKILVYWVMHIFQKLYFIIQYKKNISFINLTTDHQKNQILGTCQPHGGEYKVSKALMFA